MNGGKIVDISGSALLDFDIFDVSTLDFDISTSSGL
jgi:hypothetical protein